jgi:hypothetical protein
VAQISALATVHQKAFVTYPYHANVRLGIVWDEETQSGTCFGDVNAHSRRLLLALHLPNRDRHMAGKVKSSKLLLPTIRNIGFNICSNGQT